MDTQETKKNTRELYKALRYSLLSKNVEEESRPVVRAFNCLFIKKEKQLGDIDTYALLKREIIKHDYPLHELANIKALVKSKISKTWFNSLIFALLTYILDRVYNAEEIFHDIFPKLFRGGGNIDNQELFWSVVILALLMLFFFVLISAMFGSSCNNYLLTIIENVEADYKSPITKGEKEKQHCNNKEIASQCKVNEPSLEPNDITYMITIHKT